MQLFLDMPFPPSMNHIWRAKKTGGVYRAPAYILWIKQADQLYVMQKHRLRNQMLLGKFHCLLEIYTSDGRKRRDADNRMKVPLDYATRIGLIKDDSYCERGTFAWVKAEDAPPHGARLTIWDAG